MSVYNNGNAGKGVVYQISVVFFRYSNIVTTKEKCGVLTCMPSMMGLQSVCSTPRLTSTTSPSYPPSFRRRWLLPCQLDEDDFSASVRFCLSERSSFWTEETRSGPVFTPLGKELWLALTGSFHLELRYGPLYGFFRSVLHCSVWLEMGRTFGSMRVWGRSCRSLCRWSLLWWWLVSRVASTSEADCESAGSTRPTTTTINTATPIMEGARQRLALWRRAAAVAVLWFKQGVELGLRSSTCFIFAKGLRHRRHKPPVVGNEPQTRHSSGKCRTRSGPTAVPETTKHYNY